MKAIGKQKEVQLMNCCRELNGAVREVGEINQASDGIVLYQLLQYELLQVVSALKNCLFSYQECGNWDWVWPEVNVRLNVFESLVVYLSKKLRAEELQMPVLENLVVGRLPEQIEVMRKLIA